VTLSDDTVNIEVSTPGFFLIRLRNRAPQGEARRVRLRHLHRDGHPIWFEVTHHNLLADPERPCVVAEMLDISDEMAAQEALRAGEQLMRRLTETIPMGIVQIDAARLIVYQNERAARAIGAGLGDVLGEDYLSPIVPADRRPSTRPSPRSSAAAATWTWSTATRRATTC
jgi:PAS domain-containing protein